MAVFTENMNRMDPEHPEQSLRMLDGYIRYMQERIEFANGRLARSLSASGASTKELQAALGEVRSRQAAQASELAGFTGQVNGLRARVEAAEGRVPLSFHIDGSGHLIMTLPDSAVSGT